MSKKYFVTIGASSFFKIVLLLLLVGIAYIIWDILVLLFIAIILSFLIDPLADWAKRKHIPREVTVILVYIIALGILSSVLILLVPALISQFNNLSVNFGSYWESFISKFYYLKNLGLQYGVWEQISKFVPTGIGSGLDTAQKVVGSVVEFFGDIASLILVLVIAFYLVAEEDGFRKLLHTFTPEVYREEAEKVWELIKEKLGRWLRGQLILDFLVGLLTYMGLLFVGAEYALLLGLLVGVFETIPYLGPIFAALVGVVLTFLQTGTLLQPILVLIVFVAVQQLESYFLVPKVMQKTVGINPIVSILSLIIGFRLFGFAGALLAIPTAAVLSVVWSEIIIKRFTK